MNFERTELLIGTENAAKLAESSVIVFGVGGVGGYAAEVFARCGIGKITLVDFDVVDKSNINRQIIALNSTVGKSKAEVLKERILDINPTCAVTAICKKADKENIYELLNLSSQTPRQAAACHPSILEGNNAGLNTKMSDEGAEAGTLQLPPKSALIRADARASLGIMKGHPARAADNNAGAKGYRPLTLSPIPLAGGGLGVGTFNYVIDAIDSVEDKAYLIKACKDAGLKVISALGAGNRYKGVPQFEVTDIFKTENDPLAKVMRKKLKELGVDAAKVVYTKQPADRTGKPVGSIVYYPAICGLTIASVVINEILK